LVDSAAVIAQGLVVPLKFSILDRMIYLAAEREEKSVNRWMEDALSRAALESSLGDPKRVPTGV